MRMTLFRKLCLTFMGIGVISSLMSVGTFATFTATTTNPSNTFAAGTLKLTNVALSTGQISGPNITSTGSGAQQSGTSCTNVVASSCQRLLSAVSVASDGLEPGQYVTGTITVTNSGTLPSTVAMQVQNLKTDKGGGSNGAAFSACPTDNSATSPTSGSTTTSTLCTDLGKALNITIEDAYGSSGHTQCVFGSPTTSHASNGTSAAPSASNTLSQTYVAVGFGSTGTTSDLCDGITTTANLGTAASPSSGQIVSDAFGTEGSSTVTDFAFFGNSGTSKYIFVPGDSSTKSLTTGSNNFGGVLTGIPQWAANEVHTFTVTIAFPDSGSSLVTDANSDSYYVSKDDKYQGGGVSFDLVWLASQ